MKRFEKIRPDIKTTSQTPNKVRNIKYHDTSQLIPNDFNIPKAHKVVYEKNMEMVNLTMYGKKFDKELGVKLDNIATDFEDKKHTQN